MITRLSLIKFAPRWVPLVQFVRANANPGCAFATSASGFAALQSAANHSDDALAKYRRKLEEKARSEGFMSVETLLAESKKKKQTQTTPQQPMQPQATPSIQTLLKGQQSQVQPLPQTQLSPSRPQSTDANLPAFIKPLHQIVDIARLSNELPERIELIWNEYHSSREGLISGVMQSSFYKNFKSKGKEFPLFILPLPRESGVEFYLLQFAFNQIYYTSLLEYKTKQTEAKPRLTLTHYDDFSHSKNIVLMRGEVDTETSLLKPEDARLLVLLTQMFYATGGESKKKLVEIFNKSPQEFDYQLLISECEKLV
ncbi:hypothetical protein HK100_007406 [Physocladia obscura]|uniref:ATP synthase mitochondrial F1 complex assembly factor 1 n=1 Tax=Physocladia obscura TaxID=109957 RepID=A0AAD5SPM0_9FUNG|nr:hypothetical protein HK100_007406 [Physocladia obscura]